MGTSRVRLDRLLVDRGLAASRERAQGLILAAKVLVNGRLMTKAGQEVPRDSSVDIIGAHLPFVSRGGLKLQHALDTFRIPVRDAVALDVGASTGGFTDCLLQYGARRVYAVDVGYGQLSWKLRGDPRVVALERQNIRYLSRELIPQAIQLAVIDVSFISLKLVIPAILPLLDREGRVVALIKPQFEVGRGRVGKGGVVRDAALRREVCRDIAEFCEASGLRVVGITPSPLLGPKGNEEFLLYGSLEAQTPLPHGS